MPAFLKIILFASLFILGLEGAYIYNRLRWENQFVYSTTHLNGQNISNFSQPELNDYLDRLQNQPLQFFASHNFLASKTLREMGIVLNKKSLLDQAFTPNRQFFLIRLLYLTGLKSYQQNINLSYLLDAKIFQESVDFLNRETKTSPQNAKIDLVNNEIVISPAKNGFLIDEESLKKDLLSFEGKERIEVVLKPASPPISTKDLESVAGKITELVREPWSLTVPRDWYVTSADYQKEMAAYPFLLNRNVLIELIDLKNGIDEGKLSLKSNGVDGVISALTARINTYQDEKSLVFDKKLDEKGLLNFFQKTINHLNETGGLAERNHLLKIDQFPKTTGEVAAKYLEVDISQQRLYRFGSGKLEKSYIVSTGKLAPTPQGTFKINNKIDLAWSDIAKVWMPYWMMFTYNNDLGAYLGFHELPYWNVNGQVVRRSFDTLGQPVTGGCIQLNVGDAKEVYDWTEIGIPILIHW